MKATINTIVNGKHCELKLNTNTKEVEGYRSGKGKIKLIDRASSKRYKFDYIYDETNDKYFVGIKHRGRFNDFELTPFVWKHSGSYDVNYVGSENVRGGFIAKGDIKLGDDGEPTVATWAYIIDKFIYVIDQAEALR